MPAAEKLAILAAYQTCLESVHLVRLASLEPRALINVQIALQVLRRALPVCQLAHLVLLANFQIRLEQPLVPTAPLDVSNK